MKCNQNTFNLLLDLSGNVAQIFGKLNNSSPPFQQVYNKITKTYCLFLSLYTHTETESKRGRERETGTQREKKGEMERDRDRERERDYSEKSRIDGR